MVNNMAIEMTDKNCAEMTNVELADFIEMGAWREGATSSDASAYMEAVKRLRLNMSFISETIHSMDLHGIIMARLKERERPE